MKKFAISFIVFCSALAAYPYYHEQVVVTRPCYQTQTVGFGYQKARRSSRYGFSFSMSQHSPGYCTEVYDVYRPAPCHVYHYCPCYYCY